MIDYLYNLSSLCELFLFSIWDGDVIVCGTLRAHIANLMPSGVINVVDSFCLYT